LTKFDALRCKVTLIVAKGQRLGFAESAQFLIADGIPSRFALQQQRCRGRAVSHRTLPKRSLEKTWRNSTPVTANRV
jgi:hypothetical protein